MVRLVNKFEVGCDPEFVLLSEDRIVNVKGKLAEKGPVGWDHSGYVLEVRPPQGRGTYSVMKRMQNLLGDENLQKFASHKWRAGAYIEDTVGKKVTLGGHIHFGIPKADFTAGMVSALDSLGKLLEEIDVLPHKESKLRRADGGGLNYGAWGQLRTDWPDGHVEYRTYPSWLHHRKIAFLVLTMAKLAVVAPEEANQLGTKSSVLALRNFVERFAHKDINADRLLRYLESPSWLKTAPDSDIRKNWEVE